MTTKIILRFPCAPHSLTAIWCLFSYNQTVNSSRYLLLCFYSTYHNRIPGISNVSVILQPVMKSSVFSPACFSNRERKELSVQFIFSTSFQYCSDSWCYEGRADCVVSPPVQFSPAKFFVCRTKLSSMGIIIRDDTGYCIPCLSRYVCTCFFKFT